MRTSAAKTPRLRLSPFSRSRCAKEPRRRARLGDGSFSPGVTFGTQSSAIKAVCKNIRSTGISLYMRRRRRSRGITRPPGYITSSPGISRHDLSRSRGGGRGGGRGDLVGGRCGAAGRERERGRDRERENKTESRDEKYERTQRRGRAACREGGRTDQEGGCRKRGRERESDEC